MLIMFGHEKVRGFTISFDEEDHYRLIVQGEVRDLDTDELLPSYQNKDESMAWESPPQTILPVRNNYYNLNDRGCQVFLCVDTELLDRISLTAWYVDESVYPEDVPLKRDYDLCIFTPVKTTKEIN
jgi:hypothetical protein